HEDCVHHLVFTADGRRVLTGSSDHTLRLWDVETGQEIRCFTGHTDRVEGVALSTDGKLALSGSRDGSMRLWDVATAETLRVFQAPGGPITAVAISPDGPLALSGSGDKSVRLWRLPLTCKQAIADLTAAIRLDPNSVSAHVLRSSCYLQQECYGQALADV